VNTIHFPTKTKQEKRVILDTLLFQIRSYGIEKDCLIHTIPALLLELGQDVVKSCGCVLSESYEHVHMCKEHKERQKRMDAETPKECYCGQVDVWCAETARALRRSGWAQDDPDVAHWRDMRAEHKCYLTTHVDPNGKVWEPEAQVTPGDHQ